MSKKLYSGVVHEESRWMAEFTPDNIRFTSKDKTLRIYVYVDLVEEEGLFANIRVGTYIEKINKQLLPET